MSLINSRKRKREQRHPYLIGNFAPVPESRPLTPCSFTGQIPEELWGGEYIRNGGNPVTNEDLGRDAHFFDGDGMLSGVAFTRTETSVQPQFVNQYILTDVYLSSVSSKWLRKPILPSVATMVNPLSSLFAVILSMIRAVFLVILSRLPGSEYTIKKISVANTSIIFHDGRALATCESGPPMRVALPGLETVGWYNGKTAEGEKDGEKGVGFGGDGLLGFFREWTTAHPRIDPTTGELILFHSTFAPPFVHYSIVPATFPPSIPRTPLETPSRLLNAPIPGIKSAKMMHDFGVSLGHTIIMDLPLSMDLLNLAKNKAAVAFDLQGKSRFGVFPRYDPGSVRWFETKPCCIFHTANTWDEKGKSKSGELETTAVNLLACRMTSAAIVYSTGNLLAPQVTGVLPSISEELQCRLYYYQFGMKSQLNDIKHQFALSAVPFEFPSIRDETSMSATRYVYGCSTSQDCFDPALGRTAKIDCLVKMDVETLIKRGRKDPSLTPVSGCVDMRTVDEVLASKDPSDPIQVFRLPAKHYAQESRFVSRFDPQSEDDGWILTYVFDESQLDADGECGPDARSELWIVDARDMKTIVCKIHLPMRVPYGLHGTYFAEHQVLNQRPVETIRGLASLQSNQDRSGIWMAVRRRIERVLA